jgi:hypothetical protein
MRIWISEAKQIQIRKWKQNQIYLSFFFDNPVGVAQKLANLLYKTSGVDPYSHWECGSGSSRAKMTHKNIKEKKFHILKCWMSFMEAK